MYLKHNKDIVGSLKRNLSPGREDSQTQPGSVGVSHSSAVIFLVLSAGNIFKGWHKRMQHSPVTRLPRNCVT